MTTLKTRDWHLVERALSAWDVTVAEAKGILHFHGPRGTLNLRATVESLESNRDGEVAGDVLRKIYLELYDSEPEPDMEDEWGDEEDDRGLVDDAAAAWGISVQVEFPGQQSGKVPATQFEDEDGNVGWHVDFDQAIYRPYRDGVCLPVELQVDGKTEAEMREASADFLVALYQYALTQ